MPVNVVSRSPVELLRMVMARDIPFTSLVLACAAAAENEREQDELLRLISRTVAAMGYPKLVHELGQAVEEVDVIQAPDHFQAVPPVKPVVRLRVSMPCNPIATRIKHALLFSLGVRLKPKFNSMTTGRSGRLHRKVTLKRRFMKCHIISVNCVPI